MNNTTHPLELLKIQSGDKWRDWKWQLQNRIKDLEELNKYIHLSEEEKSIFKNCNEFFSFACVPYYLSLISANDPNCPIRKQIIPQKFELIRAYFEVHDPLGEESNMPVKGVTHRYPDRALWYLSHSCAMYCRFCTRKRKVGKSADTPRSEDWDEAIAYFETHKEIKEVILSGGDPLSLSDNMLDYLLSKLKSIFHINHIRIHTRFPVTLPFRITKSLCKILSRHFPIFIVTHFNHPNEITKESTEAIKLLICKGNAILLNQSVLLSGINDNSEILSTLNYKLVSIGIKPYYLHQCDEVFGSSGFKVPIERGMEIMKELRGYHSGITIPSYVIDLTQGGGKVPLPTDYLEKEEVDSYTFRNYKGDRFRIGR